MARIEESDGWYQIAYQTELQKLSGLIASQLAVSLLFEFDTENEEDRKLIKGSIHFPSGEKLELRYMGSQQNFLVFFSKSLSLPFFASPEDTVKLLSDRARFHFQQGWRGEKASEKNLIIVRSPLGKPTYSITYAQVYDEQLQWLRWQMTNVKVDTK